MAFRAFTFKAAVRSAVSLDTHLAKSPAAVERYSLIRNFFRQQRPSQTPTTHELATKFRSLTGFPGTKLVYSKSIVAPFNARQFHATSHWGEAAKPPAGKPPEQETDSAPTPSPPTRNLDNYSQFFRRLALAVPHPHRPTRDDLLNVATGFWQRTRIRFKWFTIKSFRKFDADDMSAFITWFLMSQTLWILVGT